MDARSPAILPGERMSAFPLAELVGYAAAALTTASFIPQAVKSWTTKDLSGVSLGMYTLFTLGVGLWMV